MSNQFWVKRTKEGFISNAPSEAGFIMVVMLFGSLLELNKQVSLEEFSDMIKAHISANMENENTHHNSDTIH